MSEYQYYEFLAIDRPLDKDAQKALRSVSSRAQITATSFANRYDFGDLHGEPLDFMQRWFDLHLYVANWGTRRLMMRVPSRFLNKAEIDPFLRGIDWVKLHASGDNVIVDIDQDEEADEEWEDGAGRLASLAPLRADVLSGDLRLFYLLWRAAAQDDELVLDDEVEPMPGVGPLTAALQAFAEFFRIDGDLVQAAAEVGAEEAPTSPASLRAELASVAEDEKADFLLRVLEGDSHVATELRRRLRKPPALRSGSRRTVGELRARVQEIREAAESEEEERLESDRRRQAKKAEAARRVRIEALKTRGERVWREIEQEIERRVPLGYDKAADLLSDLQALAAEQGSQYDFTRRLSAIRQRHVTKRTFIERLDKLGLGA